MADDLNHMEQGIEAASSGGSGTLFVRYDHMEEVGQSYVYFLDKTWQEVHDALNAGKVVVTQVFSSATDIPLTVRDGGIDVVCNAGSYGSQYEVATFGNLIDPDGTNLFDTLSAPTDYLTITKFGK